MKCTDCQFNLLCHAGRLDGWSADQQSAVVLCPVCNRLSVGQHETMYVFACEKRQLDSEACEFVQTQIAMGEIVETSAGLVKDPGPGLIGKLQVAFCLHCLSVWPPDLRENLTIKYLDENREVFVKDLIAKQVKKQRAEAVAAEEPEKE